MRRILFCWVLAGLMGAAGGVSIPSKAYRQTVVEPVSVTTNAAGHILVDFGKDRYGWIEFLDDNEGDYDLRLGEIVRDGAIFFAPEPAKIRAIRVATHKYRGRHRVPMPLNPRNASAQDGAILLPPELGVVMPIRAVEIVEAPFAPTRENVRMVSVAYGFDAADSCFSCSDAQLVRVWDFCKHAVSASTVCGLFIDGDRERLPYEGDSFATQLAQYSLFDDTEIARATFEYLMDHPSWPTEGMFSMIMIAWNDYRRTGDKAFVEKWFDRLVREKLNALPRRADGLLVSNPKKDLTDWPQPMRDGFVFEPVNGSVNAYRPRALEMMAELAAALGRTATAERFAAEAVRTKAAFNRVFFNAETGLYKDGEKTDHASMHVNALALAFGLAPVERREKVAAYVATKTRAGSPYFTMYALEALIAADREADVFAALTADDNRSWLGMLRFGATMGMECWNMELKPNLDVNHSWVAIPAYIIAKWVLGVDPRKEGWTPADVQPHLGPLTWAEGTIPTRYGFVHVRAERQADGTIKKDVTVRPKGER